MARLRRYWPLLLVLAVIGAAWAGGLTHEFTWAALARNQTSLTAWVTEHPIAAPTLYVATYAATAAVALPEGAVLTVAGGLLFGTLLGGSLAVVGSTLGSIVLFLAARYHLADAMAARAGGFFDRVRARLKRDGFSYLLALRLIPAFPFWLVNLAAALCGMRLLPYVAATLLGVIPATFIYASIGAGVGNILAAGGEPNLAVLFSPAVLAPLIGLAALSLLPVAWRKWRRSDA